MSEHYDFHYQPTGSGAISGQQVLQQTEDAINELGDYVNDNVGGAMDVAQQALETAQNAEQDAQTALDTANSFSDAIQSAQQDASTALSTAQTAQTTASNANNTAIQAQQDANTAVTTANNALGQVSTLSGTVTALGQRVTTAEGNIGQNTSDITALGQRVTTAEGNITTLQNDVTIAQGNASSAMATAGQVKQQAFVFRYSSTALVASSTNSNTLLDNTDNLKVGDKVIDSSGVLFSITAIDTQNSTFTIGTALIDLAQDSDVVHKSGNETISGDKVFDNRLIKNIDVVLGTAPSTGKFSNIEIADNNKASLLQIMSGVYGTGDSYARFFVQNKTADDGTGLSPTGTLRTCGFNINLPASSTSEGQGSITPRGNKTTDFGLISYQWRNLWCEKLYLNGTQLDPSAFVTTDTNQTISGIKTFTNSMNFKSNVAEYGVTGGNIQFYLMDKNGVGLSKINQGVYNNGLSYITLQLYGKDSNNQTVTNAITYQYATSFNNTYLLPTDNSVWLGNASNRWKKIYGIQYYYGSDNVEFSTKFVTTDTAQTVSGQKVFTDINAISNSSEIGVSGGNTSYKVFDKNKKTLAKIESGTYSTGMVYSYWLVNNGSDVFNGVTLYQPSANLAQLRPYDSTLSVQLGASNRYFSDCCTSKINGLEPGSLSLPSGNVSDVIDISSYITDLSGNVNNYTAPANGWISIAITGTAIAIVSSRWSDSRLRESSGNVRMLYPVLKNETLAISVIGTTLDYARFIPCQGNV